MMGSNTTSTQSKLPPLRADWQQTVCLRCLSVVTLGVDALQLSQQELPQPGVRGVLPVRRLARLRALHQEIKCLIQATHEALAALLHTSVRQLRCSE
jgi:hypothetical protein